MTVTSVALTLTAVAVVAALSIELLRRTNLAPEPLRGWVMDFHTLPRIRQRAASAIQTDAGLIAILNTLSATQERQLTLARILSDASERLQQISQSQQVAALTPEALGAWQAMRQDQRQILEAFSELTWRWRDLRQWDQSMVTELHRAADALNRAADRLGK